MSSFGSHAYNPPNRRVLRYKAKNSFVITGYPPILCGDGLRQMIAKIATEHLSAWTAPDRACLPDSVPMLMAQDSEVSRERERSLVPPTRVTL